MDYASKLLYETTKLDALLEAFECRYLRYVEIGVDEHKERNRASAAFYCLRDCVAEISEIAEAIGGAVNLAVEEYDRRK